MPQRRMNSLKSRAMNCGPLSEMMRGEARGNCSRARCKMISTSASVIASRISPSSDTLAFQRLVPAFDLAVRLRIERRGPDVSHAAEADEFLEVAGDELRPVVRDDAGRGPRKLLPRPLQNDLDFGFGHRFANLPELGHTRLSTIGASVRSCRSTADRTARSGRESCRRGG